MSVSDATDAARRGWLSYRMVWRWHFYAGLFVIPFVLFLSVTGSIYLFRPQIEAWLDRPYDNLSAPQSAVPSRAVAAVLAANPGWILRAYQLPEGSRAAAQIVIARQGVERRVYVDRSDLTILYSVGEEERPMRRIFRLHGELLAGSRGSNLVELVASWTIVMLMTGLFLWWPRGGDGLGGVLYPRLGRGRRTMLRDLHAVTGIWVSLIALAFLLSGLPWASNWGSYLRAVRNLTGNVPISENWTTGSAEERRARQVRDSSDMHAMHHAMAMPGMETPQAAHGVFAVPAGLDVAVALAQKQGLAPPVMVSPLLLRPGHWSATSQSQNRPRRAVVTIDSMTARVAERTEFSRLNWLDRAVGYTTAAHEGQLFGTLNQLLNLSLAAALIGVCVTAIWMWWGRRPQGSLGAPLPDPRDRIPKGLVLIVAALGVLLPEFLASLLLMLVLEWAVLRRIAKVRTWLVLSRS